MESNGGSSGARRAAELTASFRSAANSATSPSRSVGRSALAGNFERAAEMTQLPQNEVMQIYELLRPGRAESKDSLLAVAQRLRREFDAPLLADFIAEAAEFYEKRGLFQKRY